MGREEVVTLFVGRQGGQLGELLLGAVPVRSEALEACTNAWKSSYLAPVIGVCRSAGVILVRIRGEAVPTASDTRSSIASVRTPSDMIKARLTEITSITPKLSRENWTRRLLLRRLIEISDAGSVACDRTTSGGYEDCCSNQD